jgi:hypothetical protein
VEVDPEERRLALGLGDDMALPDPVEKRLRHRAIVTRAHVAGANGSVTRTACHVAAPSTDRTKWLTLPA